MIFNNFDLIDDDLDLQPGAEGYDTEENQVVTFVCWTDDEQTMIVVKGEDGNDYMTYPEEIDWKNPS
jgi:hypothetical protein